RRRGGGASRRWSYPVRASVAAVIGLSPSCRVLVRLYWVQILEHSLGGVAKSHQVQAIRGVAHNYAKRVRLGFADIEDGVVPLHVQLLCQKLDNGRQLAVLLMDKT